MKIYTQNLNNKRAFLTLYKQKWKIIFLSSKTDPIAGVETPSMTIITREIKNAKRKIITELNSVDRNVVEGLDVTYIMYNSFKE